MSDCPKTAWRKRNPEKVYASKLRWMKSPNGKASARAYYKKSPLGLFSLYKKSAKKRGLSFTITYDQFVSLIFQACLYCGHKPISPDRNGLDRVDNELGYEIDNVVPCCHPCNSMKGKRTVDDFVSRCNRIVTNMRRNNAAQKED